MITLSEFKILIQLLENSIQTQRNLAESVCLSLGTVNSVILKLKQRGLLDSRNKVTGEGLKHLEPYRVNNAVILAAGMSTRFAPLSYEKPKGLLNVKGEVLIERQIKQLHSVGIKDITLVVGYMKEKMFYLEEKYGVEIIVNEDYYKYNNTSSMILVEDRLSNTYICSSDNYFVKNPFEKYVYKGYYSAVYEEGYTDEYCIVYDKKDRIIDVKVGGKNSWIMLGHVYFDREFSKKFSSILKDEYNKQAVRDGLWEDLYIKFIAELNLFIRKYDKNIIREFDSLDELREFDGEYLKNTNSKILSNIAKVLKCKEEDIEQISPIKTGLTNTSFKFSVLGKEYVYRHPGKGTEEYINRNSEAASMEIAKKLGIDNTYIYMDEKGWKISHYIEGARNLDYHNNVDVEQALKYLKLLHSSGEKTEYEFDIWSQIDSFLHLLSEENRDDFEDMDELLNLIDKLKVELSNDQEYCLCHCDSYDPNFLIDRKNIMYLIDWEYSGMAHPAVDLGTFIACSDYNIEEAKEIIKKYLGEEYSIDKVKTYLGYTAVISFYWFLWALHQDSLGKNVGKYLYIWYKYTKIYAKEALKFKGVNF